MKLVNKYIEFVDVRKIYQMGEIEIKAIDGVNFYIDKGQFVVIAGASGAGKSTILNILGGMDKSTSGEIYVDGKRIDKYYDDQNFMDIELISILGLAEDDVEVVKKSME